MNIIKKNQIIIYAFALMLVTAGYLNYTSNVNKESVETSSNEVYVEESNTENNTDENKNENNLVENENNNLKETNEKKDDVNEKEKIANIGDATLVNSNDVVAEGEYFIKSKLERENMYSQSIETYEKILNSSNSNETQKQTATQEIKRISDEKNKIMICENLIKTKGFKNVIIFVNEGSISVIIDSKEIKQEEIAQIQNIVSRELNCKVENIHISTK